jgi:hypothetical protein
MPTSPLPSRHGRSPAGTPAVSRLLPEIRPRFHPTPSSTIAAPSSTGEPASAAASSDAATSRRPAPVAARPAPIRSVSQPLAADGANIPAMCRLTTRPTTPSPPPTWWSCSGAIVMTVIITRFARPSTTSPVMPSPSSRRLAPGVAGSTVAPDGVHSGLSPNARMPAAVANAAAATRYGPLSGGSPSPAANRLAGSSRFGPATAPIVVAVSTEAIARPRDVSATRSAAA